ncbi:MAG TPA: AAA family ATPase, partial [Flavisolibacter sp.]|nr:AAA family ATPase [Flavisolibacter sp.]
MSQIMLSRLSIQNYAIIDELEIDFSFRLNVITGETGAGKSIIVGALGLILGQRADSNVLWKKEKKCVVEGCFKEEAADQQILRFLKEAELDIADELTVRREIAANGKSRAFINDTPVNLSQLNALSSLLVDLHQQFDTLELGESDFQREVLDALANNFGTLTKYRQLFVASQAARREWESLQDQKALFEKEFDYHQFQFNELEEAGFRENELEDLDVELKMLSNAEGIKTALTKAYYDMNECEEPVVRQLRSMLNGLQPFSGLHPDLPTVTERLQSAYIELQDIAEEIDRINSHIGSDEARLEVINERLSAGYRMLKKHGVSTTNELIAIRNSLQEKLQAVLNID